MIGTGYDHLPMQNRIYEEKATFIFFDGLRPGRQAH